MGSSGSGGDAPPTKPPTTASIIDPELLSLIACPLTKQPLEVEVQGGEGGEGGEGGGNDNLADADAFLLSRAAGARFPVGRDGVPRLRPLQDGEVVVVAEEGLLGEEAEEEGERGR